MVFLDEEFLVDSISGFFLALNIGPLSLAAKVSDKKFEDKLKDPLYVMCCLFLAAFNILCLLKV